MNDSSIAREILTDKERATLQAVGCVFSIENEAEVRARHDATYYDVLVESSLEVSYVASLLSVSPSTVDQRLTNRLLSGFVGPDNDRRVSAWQFTDKGELLPGLKTVLQSVPKDQHALVVAGFMETLNEDLDRLTPRQWLLDGGDPESVALLIAQLGIIP